MSTQEQKQLDHSIINLRPCLWRGQYIYVQGALAADEGLTSGFLPADVDGVKATPIELPV